MTHQQALDTMAAERYLLDEMTEIEKHAFEDHFFDCSDCAHEVRLGEQIRAEVRSTKDAELGIRPSMVAEGVPSRVEGRDSKTQDAGPGIRDSRDAKFIAFPARPAWRRPSVVLPWAAAATLALTAGYQSLVTVPGLREATSTQALSPVMLRGATRGAVPVVTVSPGQRFVTLAMDVMTSSAKELRYDLLDEAGTTLLSGRTPLPLSGAPLYLLIPADELGRQGRHTLIVRDPDSSGAALGEYGFDVAH
jgi:hypothetical protein